MTHLIRPFRALRPTPDQAAAVAAPPYDVLSSNEARQRAAGRPHSFLHISKPEIDLPDGTDPHSPAVYAQGVKSLSRLVSEGVLVRDETPAYYAYQITMDDHRQTGLACVSSVAAYRSNRIRKHELTRPDKEIDRVRQIDALDAQTGPVLLAYRGSATMKAILAEIAQASALLDVTADDGVIHRIWMISEPDRINAISSHIDAMEALYIADGHHRSAAAMRVADQRATADSGATGAESYQFFLTVAFPHDEMRILDYNRLVSDLNGMTCEQLLAKVGKHFAIESSSHAVRPRQPGEFGMYLDGHWHRLSIQPGMIPHDDPVASLDVSLLQNHLIQPLLGVSDPRVDKRIDFVGGIRGLTELERRVDSGSAAVAFALFPTQMSALMAVADANALMPPKSTWFEPKLADGLLSHVLD